MRVCPTLFCVSVQMSSFSDGHVRHSFHAALSTEAAANMVADYVKIQTSNNNQHANHIIRRAILFARARRVVA